MNLNSRSFWNATPYPHLIIDDFLPAHDYNLLANSLRQESGRKPEQKFNTPVEKNKESFANEGLNPYINSLVSRLTSPEFLLDLRLLTGVAIIKPLTEFKDNKFRYHHSMSDGGYLGAHVDHSYLAEAPDYVHFLNCIFYMPEVWTDKWGGDTVLFWKANVHCEPNRLLIFLHTSKSWHGVSKINGSHIYKRQSLYMDYYTHKDNLSQLIGEARRNNSMFTPEFWKHGTTFIPSFKSLKYWAAGLKYLLRRPL